jgi:hypothetical protein
VFLRATGPVLVPFPIPAGSERTARDCGLVGLVAPSLRVSGLPPGGYEVAVGEAAPVRTTAADLARGVPLPLSGLPRSTAVRDYVEKREANYFSLWRGIRVGSADVPGAEEAARGMMALDDGYHAKAREAAGPLADVTIRIARAPEGENLALGKPYECSDPNRYSWGAGGLTDGSWEPDARHCFATGDGAGLPKTVTVDLGKPCRISAVRFGVPPFGSTRTVKVSVSAKGRDFTTVGSVEFPQRAAERRTVTFATATARYVRLTYEDRWPEEVQFPPVFAFTTELEVFGAS